MPQKRAEFQKAWARIVAKAWSDPEFKERLLEDPSSVLESHGIEIPAGTHLEISENTSDTFHLTLPEKPSGELSVKQLEKIAAGEHCATGNCS